MSSESTIKVEALVQAHPPPEPPPPGPGGGVGPPAIILAETLGKDLQTPAPSWPPTPARHR